MSWPDRMQGGRIEAIHLVLRGAERALVILISDCKQERLCPYADDNVAPPDRAPASQG